MKFIFLIFCLISLAIKNQTNGKKITKQILKRLESFLGDQVKDPNIIQPFRNMSNEIIEHLNIEIRNLTHKYYVPPIIKEEIEFFANYCNVNITVLKIEFYDNFDGLKALRLDLNYFLNFFLEKFMELKNSIIIPPTSPNEFLKQIYPKIYLIYYLFFDFCNKTINHGLFSRHFAFKDVNINILIGC